ncbi:MAG: hypothetical protein ACFB9M_04390 [Myxococcota bacterium]
MLRPGVLPADRLAEFDGVLLAGWAAMASLAPLPVPVVLFKTLHLLSVLLHVGALQILLGTAAVALLLSFSNPGELARRWRWRVPVLAVYALALTVPPILLGQTLYGPASTLDQVRQAHVGLGEWMVWVPLLAGAAIMGGVGAALESRSVTDPAPIRRIAQVLLSGGLVVMAAWSIVVSTEGPSVVRATAGACLIGVLCASGFGAAVPRTSGPAPLLGLAAAGVFGVGAAIVCGEVARDIALRQAGFDVWARAASVELGIVVLFGALTVVALAFVGSLVWMVLKMVNQSLSLAR